MDVSRMPGIKGAPLPKPPAIQRFFDSVPVSVATVTLEICTPPTP